MPRKEYKIKIDRNSELLLPTYGKLDSIVDEVYVRTDGLYLIDTIYKPHYTPHIKLEDPRILIENNEVSIKSGKLLPISWNDQIFSKVTFQLAVPEDECFDIKFKWHTKWHNASVHAISHNKVTPDILEKIHFSKSLITFEVSMDSLSTSSHCLTCIGEIVDFFNIQRDSQSSPFKIELWSKKGSAKSFVKNSNIQKQFCISQKKTNKDLLLNTSNFTKWSSYLDTSTKTPQNLGFFIKNIEHLVLNELILHPSEMDRRNAYAFFSHVFDYMEGIMRGILVNSVEDKEKEKGESDPINKVIDHFIKTAPYKNTLDTFSILSTFNLKNLLIAANIRNCMHHVFVRNPPNKIAIIYMSQEESIRLLAKDIWSLCWFLLLIHIQDEPLGSFEKTSTSFILSPCAYNGFPPAGSYEEGCEEE